jgi:hypothetical protein
MKSILFFCFLTLQFSAYAHEISKKLLNRITIDSQGIHNEKFKPQLDYLVSHYFAHNKQFRIVLNQKQALSIANSISNRLKRAGFSVFISPNDFPEGPPIIVELWAFELTSVQCQTDDFSCRRDKNLTTSLDNISDLFPKMQHKKITSVPSIDAIDTYFNGSEDTQTEVFNQTTEEDL